MLNTFIPLTHLQRCGGWPEWFYYRIVVTFRAVNRGKYHQTILFDFKKVPKLVRHVLVEVGDFEDEPADLAIERNGCESTSPPAPLPISLPPVQSPVLDSVTGEPVHIADIEDCDLQHHEVMGMNRWNYSVVMGKFNKLWKRLMSYGKDIYVGKPCTYLYWIALLRLRQVKAILISLCFFIIQKKYSNEKCTIDNWN